jgi:hypothetical protein
MTAVPDNPVMLKLFTALDRLKETELVPPREILQLSLEPSVPLTKAVPYISLINALVTVENLPLKSAGDAPAIL